MPDATKDHSRVTPEGRKAGEQLARITEPNIARLATKGEPDERCKTCAFRLGTVPNGCIQTQLDALKAVVEGVPFLCHQADRNRMPCHGWYAGRVAMREAEMARGKPFEAVCPWEFSAPDEETHQAGRITP